MAAAGKALKWSEEEKKPYKIDRGWSALLSLFSNTQTSSSLCAFWPYMQIRDFTFQNVLHGIKEI